MGEQVNAIAALRAAHALAEVWSGDVANDCASKFTYGEMLPLVALFEIVAPATAEAWREAHRRAEVEDGEPDPWGES